MRLGIASPLPPERSGIADYMLDLLDGFLEIGVEVELFSARWEESGWIRSSVPIRPLRELPERYRRGAIDLPVYQIGNNVDYHEAIYRAALEVPGLVVLHECMLHHLIRGMTLARGLGREFVEEMRYAAGRSGQAAAERLLATHYPIEEWAFPLFEKLVDRSRAVLVHSHFARDRVLRSRPHAAVAVAPFPIPWDRLQPPSEEERLQIRRRFAIAAQEFLVGSFGFVTPAKHLEPALEAFSRFHRRFPQSRFVVVGEMSPFYDFAAVLRRIGSEGVEVRGRVSLEELHAWMAAVDLAVNPRHPTGGEVSATLFRLLALARPVVVTAAGSFAELPEGTVAPVAVGSGETDEYEALFEWAREHPELAAQMGREGRRELERNHGPIPCAESYLRQAEAALLLSDPAPAVPPLAPAPPEDARVQVVTGIGGALGDLGVSEKDPVIHQLASTLAELGWAPLPFQAK